MSVLDTHQQHPRTDTGSSGPHWGEKKHTASVHVPLMIGLEVSCSPGIPASTANLVSYFCADANENMSPILIG